MIQFTVVSVPLTSFFFLSSTFTKGRRLCLLTDKGLFQKRSHKDNEGHTHIKGPCWETCHAGDCDLDCVKQNYKGKHNSSWDTTFFTNSDTKWCRVNHWMGSCGWCMQVWTLFMSENVSMRWIHCPVQFCYSLQKDCNDRPWHRVSKTTKDYYKKSFLCRVCDNRWAWIYDRFSINRQTPNCFFWWKMFVCLSGNDLDLIYDMTGKAHAGTDCLIFKKEVYHNNFMLGDVSLGHVGIGRALRVSVKLAAEKSSGGLRHFETSATFSFWKQKLWRKSANTFGVVNQKNVQKRSFRGTIQKMCIVEQSVLIRESRKIIQAVVRSV